MEFLKILGKSFSKQEADDFLTLMQIELDNHQETYKKKYSFDFELEMPIKDPKIKWVSEDSP